MQEIPSAAYIKYLELRKELDAMGKSETTVPEKLIERLNIIAIQDSGIPGINVFEACACHLFRLADDRL